MRKWISAVALFSLVAVSTPAMADPAPPMAHGFGFAKGNWALTLSGNGGSSKGFEDSIFSLNVAPSYFLTDNFEVGRQLLSYNDGFAGETLVFADYNFNLRDSQWVPYVGVGLGYSYGQNVSDSWRAQPEIGAKYFVNDTTYLYGNAAYSFDLNEGFDGGGWVYGVGIGFKW